VGSLELDCAETKARREPGFLLRGPNSGCGCGDVSYPAFVVDTEIELQVSAHEKDIGNITRIFLIGNQRLMMGFPDEGGRPRADG